MQRGFTRHALTVRTASLLLSGISIGILSSALPAWADPVGTILQVEIKKHSTGKELVLFPCPRIAAAAR